MAKKVIEQKAVKEVEKELVYGTYPALATEEVEYLVDFGHDKKGDKGILHPCTAELLRYNGIIK